jgi:DnaJ-class molecular chaperone
MAKSLYDELGVPRNSSPDDLKKAYRKLALQHHPDKADEKDKVAAETRFKTISEAYAVLSDENRRRLYDQTGRTDQQQQHNDPSADIHEFMRNMFGGGGGGHPFGGAGPFGPGFPFGGGGHPHQHQQHQQHQQQQKHQPPGVDIINVIVSPVDVFRGIKKSFGIELSVDCPDCSGRGTRHAQDIVSCMMCQGTGMMSQRHGIMEFRTTCPGCGGKGKAIASGKGCPKCESSGSSKVREEFTIELSPGFQDRSEIVMKGRGNKMKDAIERNEIHVVTEMRWPETTCDPCVKEIRLTDNVTGAVHVKVELGLQDLLQGIQKSVDLYGTGDPELHVPILQFPDGYRDPTKPLVLQKQGLPRGGNRGNLTVSYVVAFPENLTWPSTSVQNL